MATQVIFKDFEDEECAGILVTPTDDEAFIICACCGSIFEPDEVEIIKRFSTWVDFSDFIS